MADYKYRGAGAWGGAYMLAFIGAFVYYVQHAQSFWDGVAGFFEALVWPAFLVYHLMVFLKL